jgi:hypothetical protein
MRTCYGLNEYTIENGDPSQDYRADRNQFHHFVLFDYFSGSNFRGTRLDIVSQC